MIKKLLKNLFQFKELIQLSKTRTAKETGLVLSGNIINAVLGFVTTIILVRSLGPVNFGILTLAITVMTIASQLTDFGLGATLVKFVSQNLLTNKLKANIFLKIILRIKIIFGLLIVIIGWYFSRSLAIYIFHNPNLELLLKLSFVGSFGLTLFYFIQANLQAFQQFKKYFFVSINWNIAKFILIGLLLFLNKISVISSLLVYVMIPFYSIIISFFIIDRNFLKVKEDKKSLIELLKFSGLMTSVVLVFTIFSRLNILMLSAMSNSLELGYYSLAFQLTATVTLISSSLSTTIFPKIVVFTKNLEIINYIKKLINSFKLLIPLLILFIIFFSKPIILLFFGVEYGKSIIIFQLLAIGFLFDLIGSSLSLIYYAINKVSVLLIVSMIQLVLCFGGNYLVINNYGITGVAVVTSLIYIFTTVFYVWHLLNIKKWRINES